MAKNGKNGSKRLSKAERERAKRKEKREKTIELAVQLITARDRPLTVKQTAAKLKVPITWIYYHVGSARELRAA